MMVVAIFKRLKLEPYENRVTLISINGYLPLNG